MFTVKIIGDSVRVYDEASKVDEFVLEANIYPIPDDNDGFGYEERNELTLFFDNNAPRKFAAEVVRPNSTPHLEKRRAVHSRVVSYELRNIVR